MASTNPSAASSPSEHRSDASSPSGFIFRASLAAHRPQAPSAEVYPAPGATQASAPQILTQPLPPRNMGPLSAEVKIPPRPKPGRKPMMTDGEGGEKRKAQNRNAQRRFRDKRQQKLEDQVEVNEALRKELQESNANYERRLHAARLQHQSEVQALQQQIAQQQQEITHLKAELEKAEEHKRQFSPTVLLSRPAYPPNAHAQAIESASTPPNDNEIDFTNYGRNMGTDDKCGFCGTGDTCPCSQTAAAVAAAPTPVVRLTGPGTCAQCKSDPTGERARACMAMAASSTKDDVSSGLPANRFGRRTVPCATVVDAFRDARAEPSSIATLFGGQKMRAYAARDGDGGFDYEHNEAAKVLVQLNERIVHKDTPMHDF